MNEVEAAMERWQRARVRQSSDREAKRLATMNQRYGANAVPHGTIRMVISDWYTDEHGCLTRTVRAAE